MVDVGGERLREILERSTIALNHSPLESGRNLQDSDGLRLVRIVAKSDLATHRNRLFLGVGAQFHIVMSESECVAVQCSGTQGEAYKNQKNKKCFSREKCH